MKILSLIGIIAMIYILASWWLTGARPDDWYIAVILVLFLIDRMTDLLKE